MTKADKSKRTFFRKVAAAIGFVSTSGYLSNLMVTRSNSIYGVNENSTNDVNKQKKVWLKKQLVAMTDDDKKQMLDEILELHNKYHT